MYHPIDSPTIAETRPPYGAGEERPGRHSPIPEKLLARLWQKRAARQAEFRTNGGRRVRVLYPGRAGTAAGPDFRNALLEVEGVGLVRGDVEIHRRQQDWDAHGHRDDPNYNGVVLHAVLEIGPGATRLQSGHQAPVVSLASLVASADADAAEEAGADPATAGLWRLLEGQGYPRPETAEDLARSLDRAGDARFLEKSSRYRKFLGEQSPDQTLYEGLLEALGYRQNQAPFLRLAAAAPYPALATAARSVTPEERVRAIQSWLQQLSGLGSDEEAGAVPLPRRGFGPPLSGREWHCFRVRPANHPRHRIAGAARLVARHLDNGLLTGLGQAVDSGAPPRLTAALTVRADSGGKVSYIGVGRARDLAVNVVLPFFHGLAALAGHTEAAEECRELFRRFGKLPQNELLREMARQLFDPRWPDPLTSARRQQGLIYWQRLLAGSR